MSDIIWALGVSVAALGLGAAYLGWIVAISALLGSERRARQVAGVALFVLPVWAVIFAIALAATRHVPGDAPGTVPAEVSP